MKDMLAIAAVWVPLSCSSVSATPATAYDARETYEISAAIDYRGQVTRCIDGDTWDMRVVLVALKTHEGITAAFRGRLFGDSTPELREPLGPEARDYACGLLTSTPGYVLIVNVHGMDNFGRWLVQIGYPYPCGTGVCYADLGAALRAAGYADPANSAGDAVP